MRSCNYLQDIMHYLAKNSILQVLYNLTLVDRIRTSVERHRTEKERRANAKRTRSCQELVYFLQDVFTVKRHELHNSLRFTKFHWLKFQTDSKDQFKLKRFKEELFEIK